MKELEEAIRKLLADGRRMTLHEIDAAVMNQRIDCSWHDVNKAVGTLYNEGAIEEVGERWQSTG